MIDADGDGEENEDGTVNKLNVTCYFCKKKGHTITQFILVKQLKGKGKGDGGKCGKAKGKGDRGKGASKGKKGPT